MRVTTQTRRDTTVRATIGELLATAAGELTAAGVEQPRLDARLLLAAALDVAPQRVTLDPACPVSHEVAARFRALLKRRRSREPVARILGRREFWSLPFAISPATLDPRPDSESLVEAALLRIEDRAASLQVLDLGTGSGCLLLALLHSLPNAQGLGVDCDPAALAVAAANADSLGLARRARFAAGDWAAALAGAWDVIVVNPPYIPTAEIGRLEPEVASFDPRTALDGGTDGLESYRRIAEELPRLLARGCFAVVELGAGQGAAVAAILKGAGLDIYGAAPDLGGRERCLLVGVR